MFEGDLFDNEISECESDEQNANDDSRVEEEFLRAPAGIKSKTIAAAKSAAQARTALLEENAPDKEYCEYHFHVRKYVSHRLH